MGIQLARYSGFVNPLPPPNQTVLQYLQEQDLNNAASDQNQQKINLAKAADTREQKQFNEEDPVRAAINLAKLQALNAPPSTQGPQSQGQPTDTSQPQGTPSSPQWPSFPPGTQVPSSNPTMGPGTLSNGPTQAPQSQGQPQSGGLNLSPSLQGALQPQTSPQNQPQAPADPMQAYQTAILNKNAIIQKGLALKQQRDQQLATDPRLQMMLTDPQFREMHDIKTQNEDALQANAEAQADQSVQIAKTKTVASAISDLHDKVAASDGTPSAINNAIGSIEAKYPSLVADDNFKEALTNAKLHDPVFNLDASNNKLKNGLIGDFSKLRSTYDKSAASYVALQGIKNSAAWGGGLGDANAIRQMITLEGGKTPTDNDIKNFATHYGISDLPDLLSGKIQTSAQMTPEIRNQMMSDAQQQMQLKHQIFGKAIEGASATARANNLDPATVINVGGTYPVVDSLLNANAKPVDPQAAAAIAWAKANPTDPRAAAVLKKAGQ